MCQYGQLMLLYHNGKFQWEKYLANMQIKVNGEEEFGKYGSQ